ncbi:MAG: Pvc16 family protein [Chloroflexi bacterium]|nr:Pvc16 family protein [Chloroflexota bacterium]
MFAELDETIRQLLIQRSNIDSGEVDIAFQMPTRQWAAGISRPTINLYLFEIRENTELRNPNLWVVRRGPDNTAIKSRAEVRMDLTYKVTAFANTVEDEHRLLARALVTFLKNPLIPDEVMHSSLAGEEIPTEVASTSPNQGLAEYWGAMSNDARPSLDYRVTTRIDLSQEIEVGLALTSRLISRQVEGPTATGHVEVSPLRIGGKLHRTGDPDAGIASARLTLVERGLDTTTDSLGRFIFSGVPAGTYTVSVQSPDIYEEIRTTLQVPGQNYDIAI